MDTLFPDYPYGYLVHLEVDGVGSTLRTPLVWLYCLGRNIVSTSYLLVYIVLLFTYSKSRMLILSQFVFTISFLTVRRISSDTGSQELIIQTETS